MMNYGFARKRFSGALRSAVHQHIRHKPLNHARGDLVDVNMTECFVHTLFRILEAFVCIPAQIGCRILLKPLLCKLSKLDG